MTKPVEPTPKVVLDTDYTISAPRRVVVDPDVARRVAQLVEELEGIVYGD